MRAQKARLRRLFGVVFVATLALFVGLSLVAFRSIAIGHQTALSVARADLDALTDAIELQGLLYQRGFVSNYVVSGDESYLVELERANQTFERWLERVDDEADSPATTAATRDLNAAYASYDASRERVIALYKKGRRSEAIEELLINNGLAADVRAMADRVLQIRKEEVVARIDEAGKKWVRGVASLGGALALSIGAVAGLGYLLARRIARPLYELVLRAETAAGGARVEVSATDEIGALSEHVARLAARIEASSAELAEQRRRVSQAEKMSALGEMAAAVAHEVLNPLTGVKTAIQLLGKEDESPLVQETVVAVDEEIRRVESIARRLVSFARPYAPSPKHTPIGEILEGVLRAASPSAVACSAEIVVKADARETIHADPDLVIQVLTNLVVNACQALTRPGCVEIALHREAGVARIDVRDDGPGICPEILDRLFSPFATTRKDGHGLGLAVSQNIAIAHGGRIEHRSNAPSRGVTFSLMLPEAAS